MLNVGKHLYHATGATNPRGVVEMLHYVQHDVLFITCLIEAT
jgi:hypothetical protein